MRISKGKRILLLAQVALLATQAFVVVPRLLAPARVEPIVQGDKGQMVLDIPDSPTPVDQPSSVTSSPGRKVARAPVALLNPGLHGDLITEVVEVPGDSWPELNTAAIRPGVRIYTVGHGSCTTNFVFRGTGSRAGNLYIGTAAHCVDQDIGAEVRLGGSSGPAIGTVAYSAWKELNIGSVSCFVLFSCYSDDPNAGNDFALIEINDAFEDSVHPAVLAFGGPTGLARYSDVKEGDRILTFGNTSLRPGPDEIDAREGYITNKDEPWQYQSYIITPALPGDSGSNALLASGEALGVVVTLSTVPPAATGITALDRVLEFATSRGWEVRLQTWPLLNRGVLPNIR